MAKHNTESDRPDTLTDLDPWQQTLQMLSDVQDQMTTLTRDIKGIKRELRVLNTNLDIVRQAHLQTTNRLNIIEANCPQRQGTCIAQHTPCPEPCQNSPYEDAIEDDKDYNN